MKNIFAEFGRSIVATIFFAVILCGIYPLIVFGAAQLLFPHQANGSLLVDKSGAIRGSALLAQNFTGAQYFLRARRRRVRMVLTPTSSGGSNLGPTSSNLVANITQNIANYRAENNLATNAPVPADAVTESASGLDPHILRPTRKSKFRASPKRAAFPRNSCASWFTKTRAAATLAFLASRA